MTTGEQVLLLCDVVDSTAVTERLGDERAAALWRSHDSTARDLLAGWRGLEVDKTDGLFALFGNVADAMGFAAAYHDALAALEPPLEARAAIHSAAVLLRQTPAAEVARGAKPLDADGIAKPLTARIGALARPGQTLLSETAALSLPMQASALRALGHWRFKGVSEPMALYEPATRTQGPPPDVEKAWRVTRKGGQWLPTRDVPHSLPAERDAFVGRRPDLADLAAAFAGGSRLVTVLGVGGTGKTRLALRHGWDALGEHPGGVWFCDLSQAVTLEGVAHAVAQGLRVPLGPGDPVQQIGNAIAGRDDALVILDNFEQVARHAESTLGRWLERARGATFVVTSREVLGIRGERAVALAPLPASDGVDLFVLRARAAVGDFRPGPGDTAVIQELVNLLDGLPLSIELAASRVRVMAPSTILARMGERFKLLATPGGRRDRQATLRATLDWSWDLLSAGERAALAQLSVFEGGFTLAAAEAVVELSAVADAPWAADAVQALVQKSLLRTALGQRFEMLRSVQDYAAERLAGDDAVLRAAQLRHAGWFSALAGPAEAADRHDHDVENMVVAARRALAVGEVEVAIGALAGAWGVLGRSGPFVIAAQLADAALACRPAAGEAAATVRWVAGCARVALGQAAKAMPYLREAAAHTAPDGALALRLHCALAEAHGGLGQMAEAGDHLDQALSTARQLNDERLLCLALNERGAWLMRQSRLQESQSAYAEALGVAERAQDRHWVGGLRGNLGAIAHMLGDAEASRLHYEAALSESGSLTGRRWEGNTRCNLGLLHQESGRPAQAEEQFALALVTARYLGHRRLECTVLCNLGLLRNDQAQFDQARESFEAAIDVARLIDDPRAEGQSLGYLGLALARLGRGEDAEAAFAAGSALLTQVQDPHSLGLLHCAHAQARRFVGPAHGALEWLARARVELQNSGAGPNSELGRAIDTLARRLSE